MPAFHLLRCMVSLGGDDGNRVYRDRTRPIVYPELAILQFMHGEDAVTDINVVGTWEASNDEVLQRLLTIYQGETVQAVYPGARPRLPLADPSIPLCTLPIYKPRSPKPENPDPKLRPLDQFTVTGRPVIEAPALPEESEPTPDEIASHAQDDDDDEDLGFESLAQAPEPAVLMPRPEDLPHIVRDTHGRGSSRLARATRAPASLPDVNAGGSHAPGFVQQHRSRP